MKKIVLTVIAALTMPMAMAQSSNQQCNNGQRRGPRQLDATEMTEHMAKELNLTDSQKKKVLSLNKDMVEQMQKQQADGKKNREEYEKNLKKILTADQQKTLEEHKKMRRGGPRGPRGFRGSRNNGQGTQPGNGQAPQQDCCQGKEQQGNCQNNGQQKDCCKDKVQKDK